MKSTEKNWAIDPGNRLILFDASNQPLVCAFRNPYLNIVQPGKVTGLSANGPQKTETSMQPSYCASDCPHFHADQKKQMVTITCGCVPVDHPLAKNGIKILEDGTAEQPGEPSGETN
jgi:hypothetical protein